MVGGRGGPVIRSKTPPTRSQLTRSAFKSTLYALQDNLGEAPKVEDMDDRRDEIKGELESLRDDTQGSLDNMPDGLKEGDSGQTLQTRIDSLEEAINELEGIDCDYPADDKPDDQDADEHKDEWRHSVWDEITNAVGNIDEG